MTQDFDIEALVGGFPSIKVHQGPQPGVYEMKGGSKKVGDQRVDFVQQLFGRFPVRLIWLKDLNEDIRKALGAPLSTSGKAGIWPLPDEVSLAQLLDGLYEGGWAMFFLSNPPQEGLKAPEFLPIDSEEALSLLRTFDASVVILSWYDDIDWLIVSSPQHQ
jgi:hypothetical protein